MAIIQFRRQMVDAAKAVLKGEPAIGTVSATRHVDLASFEGVVPKSLDWRGRTTRNQAERTAAE